MSAFDTIFPADSVEFCPHPDLTDYFVCGTYNLIKSEPVPDLPGEENEPLSPPTEPRKQLRTGECLLFQVNSDEELTLLQKTSLPAILDMKWCHLAHTVDPILAIADSEGGITLHTLRKGEEPTLEKTKSIQCTNSSTLCLSLDWSCRRFPTSSLSSLIVSLSNGSLALLRDHDGTGLSVTDTWHAHDHEPWVAAWNYWDTNIVYSGGDDLKLKGWDLRLGFDQPIFMNKHFDAGVTTIQSHPFTEHILAVGSYDNTVRIFDIRKPLRPLMQVDVGGGAWRVKWHPSPSRKDDLLVACMHDGFKVIHLDWSSGDQGSQWEIVRRFDAHESLAYGVDWSFGGDDGRDTLITSCSFYDHILRLWRG